MTQKKVLPPDGDGENDDRSRWADAAILEFRRQTGSDLEDALSDLLADAMHWCDRNEIDFDNELDRARGHYDAETEAAHDEES